MMLDNATHTLTKMTCADAHCPCRADELRRVFTEAQYANQEAEAARAELRRVVAGMVRGGRSYAEVAALVGLSRQRVWAIARKEGQA